MFRPLESVQIAPLAKPLRTLCNQSCGRGVNLPCNNCLSPGDFVVSIAIDALTRLKSLRPSFTGVLQMSAP